MDFVLKKNLRKSTVGFKLLRELGSESFVNSHVPVKGGCMRVARVD
jgi:hypothetical protein